MNNRNVDILFSILLEYFFFPALIANTATQVTSAHDQRYSTFKTAAEVVQKKTSETKKQEKNTFSRGCEQAKVTTQEEKK